MLLVLWASVVGNEACVVRSPAGKRMDLNPLSEGDDYVVASVQFPAYEYLFNVCARLRYVDGVCVEGSTVCDHSATRGTSVAVYGTNASTTVDYQPYDDGSSVLTLEYHAAQCYYRPQKETLARVYFLCNPEAISAPVLSLKYENYLECEVDFNFETALACGGGGGGGGGARWSCDAGVAPGVCKEGEQGEFANATACAQGCKARWRCDAERKVCAADAAGPFEDRGACQSACEGTAGWSCVDGRCREAPAGGEFPSESACALACGGGGGKTWKCKGDTCVEEERGVSKELCEEVCK